MTEEQKRFKITRKESYEKQISQEKKNATDKAFLVGVSSAAALVGFLVASRDVNLSERALMTTIGFLNTGMGALNFKGVIEAISRKTMLEGKVEDINTELGMSENNESRGMKR